GTNIIFVVALRFAMKSRFYNILASTVVSSLLLFTSAAAQNAPTDQKGQSSSGQPAGDQQQTKQPTQQPTADQQSPADQQQPAAQSGDQSPSADQKDQQNPKVKAGSKQDVESIGNRNIGKRGLGNWYSLEKEIRMGKEFAQQIEQSAKMVQDPVVNEYVNRI